MEGTGGRGTVGKAALVDHTGKTQFMHGHSGHDEGWKKHDKKKYEEHYMSQQRNSKQLSQERQRVNGTKTLPMRSQQCQVFNDECDNYHLATWKDCCVS